MSNEVTKTTDNPGCHFFRASAADFKKIPGSPIAYWVSAPIRKIFSDSELLGKLIDARQGMATSDNKRFLRLWWEVCLFKKAGLVTSHVEAKESKNKWFPLNKGGVYRKWYGNHDYLVNWENDGEEVMEYAAELYGSPTRTIKSISEYFKESVSWSDVTSAESAFRWYPTGFIFDATGHSAFPNNAATPEQLLSYCNSRLASKFFKILNPTMHFHVGYFKLLPAAMLTHGKVAPIVSTLVNTSKSDWDSYETSWDFSYLSLLHPDYRQSTLKVAYQKHRTNWQEITQEMQCLEEENNRIFIDAYGLQDELTPEVPLNEITLTCNPHYRYGNNKNEEERETLLLADTMKELISYAVGCMFGRYSFDKPGLILANQGETIEDYYKKLQEPRIDTNGHEVKNQGKISVNSCSLVVQNSFEPDADNVIPMLDGDWFTDDITDRFCKFLKVTFGEEHYQENLTFIEKALGKDIRKYFLKDFYNDHVRRYKKRPIYWLFSSPKGTFNALIYMHRYRPDTVSVVLNDYLREFRTKLSARKNHLEAVSISASASPGEKTKALKNIESLRKMIDELDIYEREVLYPLATEQVEINLDDGVKVNYQKFGEALKKIPGLAAKDEE